MKHDFRLMYTQVEFFDDLKCEDDLEKKEVMELANRALGLCKSLFSLVRGNLCSSYKIICNP